MLFFFMQQNHNEELIFLYQTFFEHQIAIVAPADEMLPQKTILKKKLPLLNSISPSYIECCIWKLKQENIFRLLDIQKL